MAPPVLESEPPFTLNLDVDWEAPLRLPSEACLEDSAKDESSVKITKPQCLIEVPLREVGSSDPDEARRAFGPIQTRYVEFVRTGDRFSISRDNPDYFAWLRHAKGLGDVNGYANSLNRENESGARRRGF